jgi:predicted metal-binding membrane protein
MARCGCFAGVILIAAMLVLTLLAPQSLFPAIGVGIVAAIWQCSPLKQLCLNRSHNHRELAAFGIAADVDSFRFGAAHGGWCFGSCWALMLLPLLISSGHFVMMAIVTFVIISERLENGRQLSWSIRFPDKLLRIMVAQCSIRLRRGSHDPLGTIND